MRTPISWRLAMALLILAACGPAQAAAPRARVIVNGHAYSASELEGVGRSVEPGTYWYDAAAGFWGHVGGPAEGQVAPGLRLGILRQDASDGHTGTIINGREITAEEARWLGRQVTVRPGRFWMNAEGVYGLENGPAIGKIELYDKCDMVRPDRYGNRPAIYLPECDPLAGR